MAEVRRQAEALDLTAARERDAQATLAGLVESHKEADAEIARLKAELDAHSLAVEHGEARERAADHD